MFIMWPGSADLLHVNHVLRLPLRFNLGKTSVSISETGTVKKFKIGLVHGPSQETIQTNLWGEHIYP